MLIKTDVPILVIPNLPGGLQMWQGAREILPNAILCIGGVPEEIESNAGVLIFCDQIDTGEGLLTNLKKLKTFGVNSQRIRVIASLTSNNGLLKVGESFPELKIYTSCIDPSISENGEIIPGIGIPSHRLNTRVTTSH